VLAALLAAGAAHAQLRIEITNSTVRPLPIAVVPFGWEGEVPVPFDVATVVSADLGNSGRFAPLGVRDMTSRPTDTSQVNFADWRLLRVEYLVVGSMRESGPDRYEIVFQLINVISGQELLGFRLTSPAIDMRSASHRIADMIFEELTGIPGVFGTQIAYVSVITRPDGTKRYRLIVSDADGERANVIADSPQPIMSPAWSPDGRRLAYVSFEGDERDDAIYVQTLRTGTRERVSARPNSVNGAPSFSPDGRSLVLTQSRDGNLDIYTLDLTAPGGALRQITTSDRIDTEGVFSPDGRSIFFNSDRSGNPQIYRAPNEPNGRAERVTREGSNARPRVSPDGRQLAVEYGQSGSFRIALVDIQTGVVRILTQGNLDESPSFAPNGAQIIYSAKRNGREVLAMVTTDGFIRADIRSVEGEVREPVWGPYPRP
jgi:TolB protein